MKLNKNLINSLGLKLESDKETLEKIKNTRKIFKKINRRQSIINKKYEQISCGFKDKKCGKHPVCIVCLGRSFFKTKDGVNTMEDILLERYKDWSDKEKEIIKLLGN